ncbi:uncharacterized protein LOC113521314 [Galleria mellonella]|uniref:Uncharacterized protein LOC113521314 n=1 Tax=Galleria mellonella TaxID=7137 RepID=A0A6J1X7E2_GALME|nr:uncharacterized protein LOC113521314 [Galleria mellonella]
MEVVEETSIVNSTVDDMKSTLANNETPTISHEVDGCQKTNGFAESEKIKHCDIKENATDNSCVGSESEIEVESKPDVVTAETQKPVIPLSAEQHIPLQNTEASGTDLLNKSDSNVVTANVLSTQPESKQVENELEKDPCEIEVNSSEVIHNDNVTFETEILVETNDADVNEIIAEESIQDTANSILSELGHSELSEALRSSGSTENGENNNHSTRQEVFNKEELLDILEGNDVQQTSNDVQYEVELDCSSGPDLEASIALQQLSKLKKSRAKMTSRKKNVKIAVRKSISKEIKKEDSIVNLLVKDWEDDVPVEGEQTDKLKEECDIVLNSSEKLIKTQETCIDSSVTEGLNKNNEDGQPQRRFSRVIKKKVIFDPDNPDTFTKSKSAVKNKEIQIEKEEPPVKKSKIDQVHRPKSKSPISKLQWKKPSPKNSTKQNRRLTEIDRLLMDEGAVNMIYQLTPEAPKGKKNMKTKAEFIKKIQSSTPESKEMKFRERKKETGKCDEGEAKKILGGKHRASLSSSVKSPSVCEDFETHSADDSIIYRRHSSSSYSSTCMSPRRLSDVESGSQTAQGKALDNESQTDEAGQGSVVADTFISDIKKIPSSEIINRDDCLSIKEKLNSKLSLALNKRKREITKIDKPIKQKKIKAKENLISFKFLSLTFDQRVAEICIRKSGCKWSIEVFKELVNAFSYVDTRKDVSVTLLTSECGTLCSQLNLTPLLDDNTEKRTNFAYELAESIRSFLSLLVQHNKLVCAAVSGPCFGVALALVALSDIVFASECANFSLADPMMVGAPLVPGAAALTAPHHSLSQSLVKDLLIFGRQLSASDALQGGLVSRVLWPDRFLSQLRGIVKDIASQPPPTLLLKKRLMQLRNGSDITFLSCLEKERDLIVEYWTSAEGQDLLRAALATT